jgi:flagellar hook-basal body complex protein FliE
MQIPGMNAIATQPIFPQPAQGGQGGAGGTGEAGTGTNGFGDLVRDVVERTDQAQDAAAVSIQDLLAGRNQDVLPVVAAVAKADMSFKLLLGVRNKVIEAYKQTMNMQI